MNWFLYDRDLRHERIKDSYKINMDSSKEFRYDKTYVVEIKQTNMEGSLLNSLTMIFLCETFVEPSKRRYSIPRLIIYASRMFNSCKDRWKIDGEEIQ